MSASRRLVLALTIPLLTPALAEAAPARAGLSWPKPARTRLLPCARGSELPSGRGFLIAGGILAGVGVIPLVSGIVARVNYRPCYEGELYCFEFDGTARIATGAALIGLGAIFLIVGGVRRDRYNSAQATLLRPHVAHTPGGAVAGVHLRF